MRNFMCVFLLFLLNKGASQQRSLRCYETAYEGDCIKKYYSVETELDYRKKTFPCFKQLEEKSTECTLSKDTSDTCIKAIVTYVDNDTLIFTSCDSEQDGFPNCERLLHESLSQVAEKKVKSKNCEKCKKDNCNPSRTKTAETATKEVETTTIKVETTTKKVETTSILSIENTKAALKQTNKSTEILPNIAMLIFVVLIFFMF